MTHHLDLVQISYLHLKAHFSHLLAESGHFQKAQSHHLMERRGWEETNGDREDEPPLVDCMCLDSDGFLLAQKMQA